MLKSAITKILIVLCFSLSYFDLQAAGPKKKIYITNFKSKDASGEITQKIQDSISISLLGMYSATYQVIGDDDIKTIYENSEKLLVAGADSDEASAKMIANSLNADEIVTGTVAVEKGVYSIRVQNLERNTKTQEISKKSLFTVTCPEKQLDYFCREAAMKIINPNYAINYSKAPIDINTYFAPSKIESNNIDAITLQKVTIGKSEDALAKITFSGSDDSTRSVLDYFGPLLKEGDKLFEEGKMAAARNKYKTILEKTNVKLRPETKVKIQSFTDTVGDRIYATYANEYMSMISSADLLYSKNKFEAANTIYSGIHKSISEVIANNEKNTENKTAYNDIDHIVTQRMQGTYREIFIQRITQTDKKFKTNNAPDLDSLAKGEAAYRTISSDYLKLETEYFDGKISSALYTRIIEIRIAMTLIRENEADALFEKYKFYDAHAKYAKILSDLKAIESLSKYNNDFDKTYERIQKKESYSFETGRSWLDNKITLSCNRAEYLNLSGDKKRAIKILEKTQWFISLNKALLTKESETKYQNTCALVGYAFDINAAASDVNKYYKYQNSHFARNSGKYAISTGALTIISFSGALFMNYLVAKTNDDYDSLYKQYQASTNFAEATALHKKLDDKNAQAKRYTYIRNTSYGVCAVSLIAATYFTYNYFFYKDIREKTELKSGDYAFQINSEPQRVLNGYGFGCKTEAYTSMSVVYHF